MIYTTLKERAEAADIQRICAEIGNQTYFRRPAEMLARDERWKLQAVCMLAGVIRGKSAKLEELA